MRLAAVTTILLLLVLLDHLDPASAGIISRCSLKTLPRCRQYRGPQNWYQLSKDRCVGVFYSYKTFHQAETACRTFTNSHRVGHLVTVKNKHENKILQCVALRYVRRTFWIGLGRHNGRFRKWNDNTTGRFRFWAFRQPDNSWGKEGCVEFNYGEWGRWNDERCWAKRNFLCQLKYR